MTVAAIHASAFYAEALSAGSVWTVRDEGGFPAPHGDGGRAMPFWSSRARIERIIAQVPSYRAFKPFEIDIDSFKERWLPGLERDGLMAGLNWSGDRAMGYDVEPANVLVGLESASNRDHGHLVK